MNHEATAKELLQRIAIKHHGDMYSSFEAVQDLKDSIAAALAAAEAKGAVDCEIYKRWWQEGLVKLEILATEIAQLEESVEFWKINAVGNAEEIAALKAERDKIAGELEACEQHVSILRTGRDAAFVAGLETASEIARGNREEHNSPSWNDACVVIGDAIAAEIAKLKEKAG